MALLFSKVVELKLVGFDFYAFRSELGVDSVRDISLPSLHLSLRPLTDSPLQDCIRGNQNWLQGLIICHYTLSVVSPEMLTALDATYQSILLTFSNACGNRYIPI